MYLSGYKTIIWIVALGCLLPALALTEVIKTDGSVVRGEIISEGTDTIVMNVDGSNISMARSMIQEIRSDGSQSSPSNGNTASGMQVPVNAAYSDMKSEKQERKHFGRTEPEHITIGADAYWSFLGKTRNDKYVEVTGDTVRSSLMLNPYFGIHPSEIFEIRPSLFFSRTHTSYGRQENSDYSDSYSDTYTYYTSQVGLGAGVGFLFHVIHGSFFRFVLGPEIGFNIYFPPNSEIDYGTSETIKTKYDRYVDIDIPIRVPFSLDFVVSKHLGFRLSSELLSLALNINSVKLSGESTTDYTDVGFSSSLDLTKIITQLGIGVFLLF